MTTVADEGFTESRGRPLFFLLKRQLICYHFKPLYVRISVLAKNNGTGVRASPPPRKSAPLTMCRSAFSLDSAKVTVKGYTISSPGPHCGSQVHALNLVQVTGQWNPVFRARDGQSRKPAIPPRPQRSLSVFTLGGKEPKPPDTALYSEWKQGSIHLGNLS